MLKTRKYAKIRENNVHSVTLSIATSQDVLDWSHGEVKKPETINYKTYKPEKDGLFDEIIFGPIADYKCPICGTKYHKANEGQICEKTENCKLYQPEILSKIKKRTRMGHIKLASPIVHFWFFKINHSIISKVLGLEGGNSSKVYSKSTIEDIIYFKSHIVLKSDNLKSLVKNTIITINNAAPIYHKVFKELLSRFKKDSEEYSHIFEAYEELEELASSQIGRDYGIDFYELNDIIHTYSNAKIESGAKAIEYLLEEIDLQKEIRSIKSKISRINSELIKSVKNTTKIQKRGKLYQRLKVLKSFLDSGQSLKSLLIYNLPVIPVDLRPLIQIEGGRHSTSDVNELYRRIIIRNNRLNRWFELDAPILIIQNELRMLQESVDALIDNARKKPSPVMSKNDHPLKSIADALSRKKGRFRQNLLGKRVDYSGRSVIVVGPELKMHQVGMPRQMAAKLFEPWIIHELIDVELASSIKYAKKLIEDEDNKIWPFVEKAIKNKVVLLNRAPTLHRLSIQAFEPILVRGKAIMLHPLVTTAFNADFDGDQMAIHVPISEEAIREARELMLANKNILGPKDGEPIINPSQDMVLGIFYLTKELLGAKGEGNFYSSYNEMYKAYENGYLHLHARVAIPACELDKDFWKDNHNYVFTSVGKFIFNQSFPKHFPFIFNNSIDTFNEDYQKFMIKNNQGINLIEYIRKMPIQKSLNKKDIAVIVRKIFDKYYSEVSKQEISKVIKKVNNQNYNDTILMFSKLKNYNNEPLNKIHVLFLANILKRRFFEINKIIKLNNQDVERPLEIYENVELLEKVWFDYTNIVSNVLDNIKNLGFKYSMLSGTTISIEDIKQSPVKSQKIAEGEKYISQLQLFMKKGLITDDERYTLSIKKWAEIKEDIQNNLQVIAKEEHDNPLFLMMESGARGNISNFVQLAGLRGLMANNKKVLKIFANNKDYVVRSTVEVPVKSSFLEGLTAFEFYSSTHGARKGLTDVALNTAESGYLTRRLVDIAQNIIVKEEDCGSDNGLVVKDIIDTKTKATIIPFIERIEGRFTNLPVVDKKDNVIVDSNVLITFDIAQKIIAAKIKSINIRSIFGCQTRYGVCKKCYGKDLANNQVVAIGEAVGIIAAQSIGEPGTQLTMRTFHTGGVAGVEDITGGFSRLKELIDVYKKPWGDPAQIAKTYCKVIKIKKENEFNIVQVESKIDHKISLYKISKNKTLRVKKDDELKPGQKISDGPIILLDLLEYAGVNAVQNYLLKEIQRLYRMQGIIISDKYIEIIIRQMLSKIKIQDIGDSQFFEGEIVDINQYKLENGKLLLNGKKPAFGQIMIYGAKKIPSLSESFLAAASYQETSSVLVNTAIKGGVDKLEGLKENIILGHKIPAGTSAAFEENGKYDLKDSRLYFEEFINSDEDFDAF